MTAEKPDIVLVDEEGTEHRFYLYQVIELNDQSYALLQPEDSDEELVILRFEGEGESPRTLVTIDDEEWQKVADALHGERIEP